MKGLPLVVLIVVFLLSDRTLVAQNQKVDSLKQLLLLHPGQNSFDVLWGLAYELFDVDNPQALLYAKQSNEVALRNGDSLEIVKSGRILGQLLRRDYKPDEAIDVFSRVLPISQRNKFLRETKLILNGLAIAHTHRAEYDKALEYHFQSLLIREKEGDKKEISITLNNIGVVYFNLHNFEQALEYYLQSLKAKLEANYFYEMEMHLCNIGLCYNKLHDCESARKYFKQTYEFCAPLCSNSVSILVESGLGATSLLENRYEEAESHFKSSLHDSDRDHNQRYQLISLIELTKLSIKLNNVEAAKNYLKRAELLPKKDQYQEEFMEIHGLKAELYMRAHDFKNANLFQMKYSQLKDKIFNPKVQLGLMKVQAKFDERENLKRIDSQAYILALQREGIRTQKILNLLTGAVALLTMVLVFVLFKSNRRKQRINEILEWRVKERTRELERNRDELKHSHDEKVMVLKKVSSDLTSSWATLNGLSLLAAKDLPEEQAVYFKAAEATAERMVNSVNKYTSPQ